MSHVFSLHCDDFSLTVAVRTRTELPLGREALPFLERIQNTFPLMTGFDAGNSHLKLMDLADHDPHKWIYVDGNGLHMGFNRVDTMEEALKMPLYAVQHLMAFFTLSALEIGSLELRFSFSIDFEGNQNEIVAETLLGDSPLRCLLETDRTKAALVQPSISVFLDRECTLIGIIEVKTSNMQDEVLEDDYYIERQIEVTFTLRKNFHTAPTKPLEVILRGLAKQGAEICEEQIVPNIVRPLKERVGLC